MTNVSRADRWAAEVALRHLNRCYLPRLEAERLCLADVRMQIADRKWMDLPRWKDVSGALKADITSDLDSVEEYLARTPPHVGRAANRLYELRAWLKVRWEQAEKVRAGLPHPWGDETRQGL